MGSFVVLFTHADIMTKKIFCPVLMTNIYFPNNTVLYILNTVCAFGSSPYICRHEQYVRLM